MPSYRTKRWENIETCPHATQAVYSVGMWLKPNGTGALVPAIAGSVLSGLCLEAIANTDAEYTTAKYQIHFDGINTDVDRFIMPVTTGSALASMVGSPFDLDTGAMSLTVAAPGTQFEITQVFSTTLVEVKVLLAA